MSLTWFYSRTCNPSRLWGNHSSTFITVPGEWTWKNTKQLFCSVFFFFWYKRQNIFIRFGEDVSNFYFIFPVTAVAVLLQPLGQVVFICTAVQLEAVNVAEVDRGGRTWRGGVGSRGGTRMDWKCASSGIYKHVPPRAPKGHCLHPSIHATPAVRAHISASFSQKGHTVDFLARQFLFRSFQPQLLPFRLQQPCTTPAIPGPSLPWAHGSPFTLTEARAAATT